MSNGVSQQVGATVSAPDLQLITKVEVAKMLGVNPWTVWELSRTGRFPKPVRIGTKSVRWRLSDVRQWIEQGGTAADES